MTREKDDYKEQCEKADKKLEKIDFDKINEKKITDKQTEKQSSPNQTNQEQNSLDQPLEKQSPLDVQLTKPQTLEEFNEQIKLDLKKGLKKTEKISNQKTKEQINCHEWKTYLKETPTLLHQSLRLQTGKKTGSKKQNSKFRPMYRTYKI